MPTIINPVSYIIGAAEVYYRATEVLTPWTSVGATVDDVVFRVMQSMFNPSDTINGLDDLIRYMDYRNGGGAEAEFTMAEIAGSKLTLAVPGAVETAGTTAVTGGGGSSTTTAATAVGATTVPFTATTNFVVGDYFSIDTAGNIEYRQITAISGLDVSFRDPLRVAHASGVAVVETDGDGKASITQGTDRRQGASAYRDYVLVAQSPADYYELYLYNGISTTESVEIATGDETMAGVRATIGARRDGTVAGSLAWELRIPPS